MKKYDQNIKNYGKNHNVPITVDDTLDFLIDTINKNESKQILEIGTAIGYGCISIANNANIEHIDTIEIDKNIYEIALTNIAEHNCSDKITVYNMDAGEYLKTCNKQYDFIYLDGPKGQYPNYLPDLVKLTKVGGIIFADNLHFHGMVNGNVPVSKGCRAMVKGLKKYIEDIKQAPNLITTFYDVGDGVSISVVTKKQNHL